MQLCGRTAGRHGKHDALVEHMHLLLQLLVLRLTVHGFNCLFILQVQAAWRTDEIRRQKPTPQVCDCDACYPQLSPDAACVFCCAATSPTSSPWHKACVAKPSLLPCLTPRSVSGYLAAFLDLQDEMRHGLSYFQQTIIEMLPVYYRRVETALANIGQPRVPLDHALFTFGSWMGGDRWAIEALHIGRMCMTCCSAQKRCIAKQTCFAILPVIARANFEFSCAACIVKMLPDTATVPTFKQT